MYAEIPPDAIPALKPKLQVQKIVYMTNIKIENAKPFFKPVRTPFMIKLNKLNKRTEITSQEDDPSDFPKYTFFLVPFSQIPKFQQGNEYFIGTILTYIIFIIYIYNRY